MSYWDIMNLWFYDFQNILQTFKKIVEERNKAEEEEYKKQGLDKDSMNPNKMMANAQKNMPKTPKLGGSGYGRNFGNGFKF